MTRRRVGIGGAALWLVLAWTAGCGTPNVERRLAYVNQHPQLSPGTRAAIAEGRVQVGLTMEEVRAMVGEPLYVTKHERQGHDGVIHVQVWFYPGPVVCPSVMRSAANSEFLARLTFENGVLKEIREI
jgi:hypothetical protein